MCRTKEPKPQKVRGDWPAARVTQAEEPASSSAAGATMASGDVAEDRLEVMGARAALGDRWAGG